MNKSESLQIKTIDLNIVVTPDEATAGKLIDLSEELSRRFETSFILNSTNYLPHLSFYSTRYPEKNQNRIEEELTEIANNQSSFDIVLSGHSQIFGFLFFDAIKSSQLVFLHEKIVNRLNPLREGQVSDIVNLSGLTDHQKSTIEKYGYLLVLDDWVPHVTLTHFKNPAEAERALSTLPRDLVLTFNASAISLTPFAHLGTCPGLLRSFAFGKNSQD